MTMDYWDQIWLPLDASKRQIRVFVLEPRARNIDGSTSMEPPSGRLEIVSLDDEPHYDAISYSWGVATDSQPVYLGERRWPITLSLYDCLQYFRDTRNKMTLWCDAICINQFDNDERSAQVQIMQHIFMGAQTVRVWLGSPTKQILEAMKIIEQVGSGAKLVAGPATSGAVDVNTFHLLPAFTSCPWWSRLWVVQEVALARQVYFHAGWRSMNTSCIDAFLNQYRIFYGFSDGTPLAQWWKGLEEEQCNSFNRFFNQIKDIHDIRKDFKPTVVETSFLQYPMKRRATDMLGHLARSRKRQVTHMGDHIYGILGLCTVMLKRDLMRPDYTLDTSQVYIEFAFSFITVTRCLILLGQSSYIHNSITNLPSWVPDWSSSYHFESESNRSAWFNFVFTACGTIPMKVSRTIGQPLRLSGYLVDKIREVGNVCEGDWFNWARFNIIKCLVDWEDLCMPGRMNQDNSQFYITGITMWEVFRRTMFRDLQPSTDSSLKRIAADSNISEYEQAKVDIAQEPHATATQVEMTMLRAICKSRMVITTKGYIGLAPPEAQIGDSVFLLAGGDVPYVLRPDPRYAGSTTYRLIGESYIHGIMDGELVEGPDALEAGDVYLS